MPYKPCQFSRRDYLKHANLFESVSIDNVEDELCEFNNDPEDLAYELAYLRYRVAKLERFIRNGVDLGYIAVPDKIDSARDIIDEIFKLQQ